MTIPGLPEEMYSGPYIRKTALRRNRNLHFRRRSPTRSLQLSGWSQPVKSRFAAVKQTEYCLESGWYF